MRGTRHATCSPRYDPVARSAVGARYAGRHFSDRMVLRESNYEATRGAEALVVCTEWHEFRRPNFARLKEL
jgi:UDPglucose 6-dehydrogenase